MKPQNCLYNIIVVFLSSSVLSVLFACLTDISGQY